MVGWHHRLNGHEFVQTLGDSEGQGSLVCCSPSLYDPWPVAHQVPVSMEFSRQKYWSGLLFPSLGDLPNQGLNPGLQHCRQTLTTEPSVKTTGSQRVRHDWTPEQQKWPILETNIVSQVNYMSIKNKIFLKAAYKFRKGGRSKTQPCKYLAYSATFLLYEYKVNLDQDSLFWSLSHIAGKLQCASLNCHL